MNGKKKFLIFALPLVVAWSGLLGHFWSYTVCALGKAVAAGLLLLLAALIALLVQDAPPGHGSVESGPRAPWYAGFPASPYST